MEFRMTAITAKDNPSIQLYRKLVRQRKARTQNQQFVLEGYRLVTDAVHFSRKLTHLFLTEAAWERYQEEFCSLEADLRETKRLLISNELAMELTETEHPQGVFAICQMPAEQVPIVAEGTYLVLYQLQDPGNMGMLLRTAAAMGVSGVICCQSCDFYSPKVVRATMGALFHVPLWCRAMPNKWGFVNWATAVPSGLETRETDCRNPSCSSVNAGLPFR